MKFIYVDFIIFIKEIFALTKSMNENFKWNNFMNAFSWTNIN